MKEACSRNRRDIETHINRADLYSNHHRGNPISPFFPPQSTAGQQLPHMLLHLLRLPSHRHHLCRPSSRHLLPYFDPRIPTFYLISFQIPKFDPVPKLD
ncbi:hypothetical protein ACFX12_029896 [Malus domestica]